MAEPRTYKVKSEYVDVIGTVLPLRYTLDRWALALLTDEGPEVLSTNLEAYGFEQPPGHVHVKAYSEHEGLPAAVEAAGLATPVGEAVTFGPYNTSAFLMKLDDEVATLFEESQRA